MLGIPILPSVGKITSACRVDRLIVLCMPLNDGLQYGRKNNWEADQTWENNKKTGKWHHAL